MGVYTKKGDKGMTSLFGGEAISKDSLRVESYGTVDEANSYIGLIRATITSAKDQALLSHIQNKLFIVGAQLASDEAGYERLVNKIAVQDVKDLEQVIDSITAEIPPITSFCIAGETVDSAMYHVARTIVRRAERLCVHLAKETFVCPIILKYLNRLSDTLFMLAKAAVLQHFIGKVIEKIVEKTGESVTGTFFSEELCVQMSKAAQIESERIQVPVTFSVSDHNGNLMYLRRFKDAILPSIALSQNKAYTAATLKMSTRDLGKACQPGESLYGIHTTDPKIVIFGGGFPLIQNDRVVGAIGVSGGSVAEDEQIGKKALEVFAQQIS